VRGGRPRRNQKMNDEPHVQRGGGEETFTAETRRRRESSVAVRLCVSRFPENERWSPCPAGSSFRRPWGGSTCKTGNSTLWHSA